MTSRSTGKLMLPTYNKKKKMKKHTHVERLANKKVTTCVKSNLSQNGICHLDETAVDKAKQIVSKFDLMPV